MKRAIDPLHLPDLWDDTHAATLDPLGRLVYRSNLLGADWRMTNTGGGNTSSKVVEQDPITGEPVEVLWVKGSGGDLRTAGREFFSSLVQPRLVQLQEVYRKAPDRGPKTAAEDAMVAMYPHTSFNLNPRTPSIDTPLHSFIPYRHVDHMHPVAAIAIATAADGPALTRKIWGEEVVWTDWLRPGFELGLELQRICREFPQAKGVLLGGHGLINWDDDDRACYRLTLRLVNQAIDYLAKHDRGAETFGGARFAGTDHRSHDAALVSILPWLRGKLSSAGRVIATVDASPSVLEFAGSHDAERLSELGTSCPDHFLRTRIKPLYVAWDPAGGDVGSLKQALEDGLARYREDYRAYYEACRRPDSPPIRGLDPTVIVIPGLGLIGFGKSKSESRVTAEFFRCAIEVMKGAESVSRYTALDRQEAFDIEYWALEEAKLRRMPKEAELARRVVVIVGGGSGIGRATAERLVPEGAAVAVLDRTLSSALETTAAIEARTGRGIGVAGTGISACSDVLGLVCDLTDRHSIRDALRDVILAYGGIDDVVVTAGVYPTPGVDGRVPDEAWDLAYRVNAKGPFLVADEMRGIWHDQALDGSLVLTTSVNAVVPKDGSLAYDLSKAAANHLVRELAISLAPRIRVNAVAPATVVEGSAMFPRDRVIASLAKYGLSWSEGEDDAALIDRLSAFYAARTLTGRPVRPRDQAEAIFLLVSQRLSRTTGQVIHVDGGLRDAFLR